MVGPTVATDSTICLADRTSKYHFITHFRKLISCAKIFIPAQIEIACILLIYKPPPLVVIQAVAGAYWPFTGPAFTLYGPLRSAAYLLTSW